MALSPQQIQQGTATILSQGGTQADVQGWITSVSQQAPSKAGAQPASPTTAQPAQPQAPAQPPQSSMSALGSIAKGAYGIAKGAMNTVSDINVGSAKQLFSDALNISKIGTNAMDSVLGPVVSKMGIKPLPNGLVNPTIDSIQQGPLASTNTAQGVGGALAHLTEFVAGGGDMGAAGETKGFLPVLSKIIQVGTQNAAISAAQGGDVGQNILAGTLGAAGEAGAIAFKPALKLISVLRGINPADAEVVADTMKNAPDVMKQAQVDLQANPQAPLTRIASKAMDLWQGLKTSAQTAYSSALSSLTMSGQTTDNPASLELINDVAGKFGVKLQEVGASGADATNSGAADLTPEDVKAGYNSPAYAKQAITGTGIPTANPLTAAANKVYELVDADASSPSTLSEEGKKAVGALLTKVMKYPEQIALSDVPALEQQFSNAYSSVKMAEGTGDPTGAHALIMELKTNLTKSLDEQLPGELNAARAQYQKYYKVGDDLMYGVKKSGASAGAALRDALYTKDVDATAATQALKDLGYKDAPNEIKVLESARKLAEKEISAFTIRRAASIGIGSVAAVGAGAAGIGTGHPSVAAVSGALGLALITMGISPESFQGIIKAMDTGDMAGISASTWKLLQNAMMGSAQQAGQAAIAPQQASPMQATQ